MMQSLSFSGRVERIKSVIISSLAYWIKSFKLPCAVIKELEMICARFYGKLVFMHRAITTSVDQRRGPGN